MAKKTSSRTRKTPEDKPSQTEKPDTISDATDETDAKAKQESSSIGMEETVSDTAPQDNSGNDTTGTEPVSENSAPEETSPADENPSTDATEETEAEAASVEDATIDADVDNEAVPESEKTPIVQEKTVIQKASPLPLVLGGVAAGAVGFAAAMFGLDNGSTARDQLRAQIKTQSQTIEALSATVEGFQQAPDLTPVESSLSDLEVAVTGLNGRLETSQDLLEDIEARLTAVEKQPVTSGASEAAVAAYERELDALRETMAQERAEIEAMIEEARTTEDTAEEAAQAAMQRAAITRIQTALDTGAGFAGAVADLEQTGVTVPDVLATSAETGVPSLSALQQSFPDAARDALAVSRRLAAESGDNSGFSAFLRSQLGARSLEPREGNDPDAVLSRAEAALREGRLNDALAEIEALPEEGRAELSAWSAQATQRLEAVSAAQELSETLN